MKQNFKLFESSRFFQRKSAVMILSFIAIFLSQSLSAQNVTVSGKIKDTMGEPLAGVTVIVKGSTHGTISNVDGNFTIGNIASNDILVFSFIGMKTEEIEVKGKKIIDVIMTENVTVLDEVVAVGYGTVRKVDLTGSVSAYQGDDILKKKSSSILTNALQGVMPGVTVTRSNGEPNSGGTIRVRGVTTISTSDPYVLIDGVPGQLSMVKADDVESISVLKDAASASIYGSKAAAGVILVTTRRAKTGDINLSYDYQFGIDKPTQLTKKASAVPYMRMLNELKWNDNKNQGSEYSTYTKEYIENYPQMHSENPDLYPDTDWNDYLRKQSFRNTHSLSFSAGTNVSSTRASITYDKVESIIKDRPYQNFSTRVNNDVKISNMLSAHFDVNYFYYYDKSKQREPSPELFVLEPVVRAYWTDGRVANGRNSQNYIAHMEQGGDIKTYEHRIGGKFGLDFEPLSGLKIQGVFAPKFQFYQNKNFKLAIPMYNLDDKDNVATYVNGLNETSLYESRNQNKEYTTQFLVNYMKDLGKHNLNFLAGYEHYYYFRETLGASRRYFTLKNYPYLDLGPLDFRDNSGNAEEYASRSYFGRIIYSYMNKYLLQANARYDGSSRFHRDYRYGLFPSVSVGWVVSEEPFMKDIAPISFLKIRASYGSLGNERIGSYYPYLSTINFNNSLFYNGKDVIAHQNAYLSGLAVKDITWETTKSYDFGFDANFFANKLQVTADYYRKTTSGMLLALQIPILMGFPNPSTNTGNMYTNGWELSLSYRNNINDLKYSVSANLSDAKSIMGDLGGTEFLGSQVKFKGSEFNEWYGYKSEGLFQTDEEVANSPKPNNNVRPGDVKYTDISGPDGVPDGKISPEYDRVLLGGSLPRFEYGGNIGLEYKNFDFSLVFQGVAKRNSYLASNVVRPLNDGVFSIPSFIPDNYWSYYNTEEKNKSVKYPRLSQIGATGNNYVVSDYWLINGAYFRLKNVIFGYNIPEKVIKSVGLQSLRVYLNLSDYFAIDHFPEGWDPEQSAGGYYITKSIFFGASLKF
jgi:TonB-linked SusC/RagA family outer membrane protein